MHSVDIHIPLTNPNSTRWVKEEVTFDYLENAEVRHMILEFAKSLATTPLDVDIKINFRFYTEDGA
jgi:hypothetical protein